MVQQNTNSTNSKRLTMEDLPAEIQLDMPESRSLFANSCAIFGTILAFIGLFFILFGPDEVVYDVEKGPTFLQFLQAFPYTFAFVGFGIGAIGQALLKFKLWKMNGMAEVQILDKLDIDVADLPEGHKLDLVQLGDHKFKVILAKEKTVSEPI